MTQCHC